MSIQKNRIMTMIALLNSCNSISKQNLNKVKAEFHQVVDVDHISPTRRRNLLKILHSTRGLDSTLRVFLDYHGIRNGTQAIGQFIIQLEKHKSPSLSNLSNSERIKYQNRIVNLRNLYLHTADSYPRTEREVNELISDMHALLSRVMTL